MNDLSGTQAAGLQKFIEGLTPPPQSHDAEVAYCMGMARTETFIEGATLKQCADVLSRLIDRICTHEGCAPELEDELCKLRLRISKGE